MKKKPTLFSLGIVIGWGLGVILLVRLAEGGYDLWQRQTADLLQAQGQLRRLQGWLEAEPTVKSRYQEVLGVLSHAGQADLSWLCMQELQKAAQEKGLAVTDIRPTQIPRQAKRPPLLRLDVKLDGQLDQLSQFLQGLPEQIPGVRLESIQVIPRETRIQGLLQLLLPVLEGIS